MYPISSAVKALYDAEQRQVLRITGTDKNGATISITDANVMENGFTIDRYSCNGTKLEVGTAIASELTLKLDNRQGQFDGIAFEGAELFVEVGIADWTQDSPTVNWMPCGYFTPYIQPRKYSTITLAALDRMMRFDRVVEDGSLTLPATVAGLVAQVCALFSVTLAAAITGLPNASYSVSELPELQQTITYRNLIQWCAGIMGTNAWMDWNGQLRFSWYDNATGYETTAANRFSSDLHEDDITITGVQYTNTQDATIIAGTDDYALDLTGNYLAAPGIAAILPTLNTALNGFTYRPFTATVTRAPYLWPMDAITFTDRDGNDHATVLTNVNFSLNGVTALESHGETAETNSGTAPSSVTPLQGFLIEKAKQAAVDEVDEALTQEEVFNRLTDNGTAQGLYIDPNTGQIYINASYIRSGTLILGGLNNESGVLEVHDENDNVIGTWDKDGLMVDGGSIVLPANTDSVDSQGHLIRGYQSDLRLNGQNIATRSDMWPIQLLYQWPAGYNVIPVMTAFTGAGVRVWQTNSDGSSYLQHGDAELSNSHLWITNRDGQVLSFYQLPVIGLSGTATGQEFSNSLRWDGIQLQYGSPATTWFRLLRDPTSSAAATMSFTGNATFTGSMQANGAEVATVLASGRATLGSIAAGARGSTTISFASVGTTNYMVVLTPLIGEISCGAQNKTATSFDLYYKNTDTASARAGTIDWAIIKLP
jgi:hypothetical protein